jgi:hypothetical protein
MTTLDASGMTGPSIDHPPGVGNGAAPETFDALAMLREQVREREDTEASTTPVEVPGIGWRLMCDITFEYSKYAAWQTAALPKNQRNGRRPNLLKMNQTELAFNVLLHTCEEIQFQRSGTGGWETLTDAGGEVLLPTSDALLRQFNVVDPRSFLRKLFGREARLVEASQLVASKAGWIEGDGDDDEDPTG